jgi:adenylate cyclase
MEKSAKEPNEKPLRVPFRIALSTIFAVLLIAAIAALGILSYSNLRKNAGNLASQVVDQTSSRIELWVKNLLSKANDQNQLNRATLGTIKLGPETFFRLSNYWRRVMETQPYFTFISARLENGSALSIERMKDGKLTIRESQFDREKRTLEFYDFWPEDYRERKPYNHKKIVFAPRGNSSRTVESWYTMAVKAGQPVWIEARTIRKGAETVAGVSYAAPFYGPEKELRGVTSVDFDIVAISKFLAANPVGKAGFAFIIEKPPKGEPRVIAHPTPDILTHTVVNERGLPQYEFVPYRKLKDVRVAGFMEQLSRKDLVQPGEGIHIFSFSAGGTEYFGSYRKMTGKDMPNWVVASIIPREEIMGFADRNNMETLGIGLASFLLILLASAWISGRISRPLKKISNESEAIGRFELEGGPIGHSMIKEVDRLMMATDDMKRGLRSFGKYVPTDVVRDIMASGGEAVLGGRRVNLTIFFSDIEGFTSISEQLEPEALVDHLAEYLGEMNQQVRDEQGTVDKFIGDSLMAFWGAPMPNAEHALAACRAALRCQERLAVLREKWQTEGKPLFYQRIGINTGEVIVGNMGSENRMNYTVVGDHVNAASRFEGLNKFYGTNIIIGESTYELVKDHFVARPIDRVSVMGKKAGLKVYELMGDRKTVEDKKVKVAQLTTEALESYLAGRFDEAIKRYEAVRELNPGDRPVGFMLVRCRQYLENPPPDKWDGIFRLESK